MRSLRKLRHRLAYLALITVGLLGRLLPERALLSLGRLLGVLAFHLAGSARRQAIAQLTDRLDVDPDRARFLARENFAHLGANLGECLLLHRWRRRLDQVVEVDHAAFAELTRDHQRGKGVIFVTGHIGNWELMAQYLAYCGYPVSTVARSAFDPAVSELLRRWRLAGGVRTLNRGDPRTVKEMIRVFKRGEGLGILIDVDTSVPSLWVPFLGKPAKTPRTAADLALRTGAALWFGYDRRVSLFQHRIEIRRVEVCSTGHREQDARDLTARLTRHIEAVVRQQPAQWVWMHRRWKSLPASETEPAEAKEISV